MKLEVWENVIVSWVNAFSLSQIKNVHELKDGTFFINILDKLRFKGDSNMRDEFYSSEDIHPYVAAFIKEIYPDYEVPINFKSSEDITLIASLVLLWFCLKTKDQELLLPLYSLDNCTQCCIQAFLEKLLYIPSSSIAKDLVFTAILSIDDPFSKEYSSVIYSSPASPSLYRSPVYDRSREEIKTLRRDNELLKSENSYLLAEVEQQKVDHSKLALEVENKNKEILRLENELFVLSGEAAERKSGSKEKRKSGSKEKKLKNEMDELEKAVVSSKQEINTLAEDRNQLKKRVGVLERESMSWRERASELEDKCLYFETQLNQNEAIINQLQQTVVEQREFLSETHHGNITIGNDSSIMAEDISSPAASENLTSVVELKYNELEVSYQSMVAEFNKAKTALQDKDKRIYGLMAEINTNSSEINCLKEDIVKKNDYLKEKESLVETLEKDLTNFKESWEALNKEKEKIISEVNSLREEVLNLKNENCDLIKKLNCLNDAINENDSALENKNHEIEELKDSVKELNENIISLKIINKDLNDTLEMKVDLLKKATDELDMLKGALSEVENTARLKENETTQIKITLVKSTENLKKSDTDIQNLKVLLQEKEEFLKQFENESKELKKTLLEKEHLLKNFTDKCESLEQTLNMKEGLLKSLDDEAQNVKTILTEKENQLQKLDQDSKDIKEDLLEKEQQFLIIVDECKELKNTILEKEDLLRAVNEESKELKETLLEKETSLREALAEADKFKTTLLEKEQFTKGVANELETLNKLMKEKEELLLSSTDELNDLKNSLADKNEIISKIDKGCEDLKACLLEKEASLVQSENDLKDVKERLEETANSLKRADDETALLKMELESKDTLLGQLSIELNHVKEMLAEKEALLEKRRDEFDEIDKALQEKEIDLIQTRNELTELMDTLKEKDEDLKKSFAETKQVSDILLDKEQFIIKIDLEMQEIKQLLDVKDNNLNLAQAEIEDLKSKLIEKDELLKLSDTKITELKDNLTANNENTENVKAKIKELEDCLNSKQELIEKYQLDIENFKETFEIREAESKEMKETINRNNVELKRLSEIAADKEEMLKLADYENNKLCDSLKDLEILVGTLKDSLAGKESTIDKLTKESDALKFEIEVKSNEIKEWIMKMEAANCETASLKDQLDNETSIRVKLVDCNENLKSNSAKIEEEKLNLVNEVKSLSCLISTLESEKNKCLEDIECLKGERDSLKIALENKIVVSKELQEKISSLNLAISEMSNKYEEVVKENNDLTNRSEDLDKLTCDLKNQCINVTNEMKAYKNRVNDLEKELKFASEDKSSFLSSLEENNDKLQRIAHLENELSNLNELINLDKLQTKKISEEKQKLSDEISFKQREIEALTLQLIESKKANEKETARYQELVEKCEEIKELNESHLNDLVLQRKRVTELEAENLQHVFEISHLTEAREKMEHKFKKECDALFADINYLKVVNSDLGYEREKLLDDKLILEKQMQNLEEALKDKTEVQVKKLNEVLGEHDSNLQGVKEENNFLSNEIVLFKNNIEEMSKFLNEQESKMTEMGSEMKRIMKDKQKSEIEVDRCNKERFKLEQEKLVLEQEVYKKTIELNCVKSELDKLKSVGCQMEHEVVTLKREISRLSINENTFHTKIQLLSQEVDEKTMSLVEFENKLSELKTLLENEKVLVVELMSENKRVIDEKQCLLSTNQELQKCLQEKISSIVEMERKVTAVDEIVDTKKAEVSQLKAEKKALEEDLNLFNTKTNSLMSEINNMTQELSTKTLANKNLNDEVTLQKDLLSKSESKNKELTSRVETLNNLIMQYCITIQENTTYVSKLKTKMNSLKDNLSSKSDELKKLSEDYKSIEIKLDESIKQNDLLNSEVSSLKNRNDEMESRANELRKCMTQLKCDNMDLHSERNQLSNIINVYSEKLNLVNDKLSSYKKSLKNADIEIKNFEKEIADKNNEICILNNNICGLKFGLVENSKILKQILNETRFFGEVTMRIHGDMNESFRINSTSLIDDSGNELIVPKEDSPFDPTFSQWRDLQSEIIKALKNQLDCVYTAAKEKDMLCNDLNIKINDLVSEKRQESIVCENYKAQISELKDQIEEVTKTTRKLLAEKDEAITALKDEISFLSDSEVKDGLELRIKIERLIEFNSELEFKLNQAQLERDFFKEESEQLAVLKNEIKEKDCILLKMEQDIDMLKHEKNVLDKRVAFLTKDAEDVKSLKIELSDIKNKFATMGDEETCPGDIEPLTDEEKLTRIKPEFLKNDLRSCFEEAIEQIIQQCDRKLQFYREKVIKCEEHIKELSADLWEETEKYMIASQELQTLRAELAKALNIKQEGKLSLEGALHRLSFGCIGSGFDNLGCEELEKMDDVFPLNYHQRHLRNSKSQRRQSSLPKFSLMSGKVFPTEEEVEEIFSDNCLSELKAGICDVRDVNSRYLSLPSSIFPHKEPEDRRLSSTRSLQGIDNKPKKEVGQIIYRKPGPPTPSKNAGRLSLSDANGLPSTSGLREHNIIQKTDDKSTPQAHTKIKSLFTAKPKQSAQTGVTKKKSGFFRKKKERENISPT